MNTSNVSFSEVLLVRQNLQSLSAPFVPRRKKTTDGEGARVNTVTWQADRALCSSLEAQMAPTAGLSEYETLTSSESSRGGSALQNKEKDTSMTRQ